MWAKVEDLDAFIGPGCSVACEPVGLLAAAWKIPLVSWAASSATLSNKDAYPTFTRVEATWLDLAPVFDSLTDVFNWSRIGIITTQEDVYRLTAIAIMEEMQKSGKKVILNVVATTVRGDQYDAESLQSLSNIMESMKAQVRVLLLMTYPVDMRNMLLIAMDMGMMNGEFVIIVGEYSMTIMDTVQTYRPEADEIIYNGLMTVGSHSTVSPELEAFNQKVIDAFQDPRFDHLPHLPVTASPDQVNIYAGIVSDTSILVLHIKVS